MTQILTNASNRKRLFAIGVVCLLSVVCPAPAQIYVDASATGNDDGTSWTDAYTELTNAVANCGDGVEIRVAAASYSPGGTDGDSFYLTNNIISGGYPAGGGTRDPVANETILEGDYGGGNNYHVVEKTGNSTLILDGLIIQNGTADGSNPDDDGAGIYMTGGNIILSNCVVRNNYANDWAGGIWVDGANTPSPRFVNCTFSNNFAIGNDGGAIYFEAGVGSPLLSDCTFNSNTNGNSGDDRGGAIKCNDGGVLTIDNCIFRDNTSYDEGGGIAIEGDAGGMVLNVYDSEFYNNSGVRGGFLFMRGWDNSVKTNIFSNCVFQANIARAGQGAVMDVEGMDGIDFIDCMVYTNTATSHGGGLMLTVRSGYEARFINSTFTNNAAGTDDGGAIRLNNSGAMGPVLVSNCTFNGNVAGTASDDRGGAIYAEDGETMTVIDCLFTNNTAGDEGGAIGIYGDSDGVTLSAYNTKFYDNTGGNGGAVYTRSYGNGMAVISNCWFVDNYGSGWGGAIRMEQCDDVKIVDCFFPTNMANGGGGHMYVSTRSGYTGIVANIDFTNGIANNDDGGAILIANQGGQTWIITNCTFTGCRAGTAADDRGGAINAEDGALILIDDCAFTDNSAGDEGGAINIYGESGGMRLDARNLTFTDNSGANGGALYVRAWDTGTHTITNCTFTGSYASSWGGAVRMDNTDDFILTDCSIVDSTANGGGGHAYLYVQSGYTGYVHNVTFTDGTANTDDAGAVMIANSAGQNMVFTNCQFINSQCGNAADDRGGVISIEDGNIITFRDCLFTNVTAGDEGGVISIYGDSGGAALHLYNCELYDSSGADRGGGVYLQAYNGGGDHIISNCTFRNLSASSTGGGICIEGGSSLYVYNTDFSQCESSGNYGGGIYASAGASWTSVVYNCTFHTNVSYSGGGAIYLSEGDLNITNTIFYGNDAGGTGDEIYGDGGDTLNIGYCNIDSSKIENIGTVNSANLINTNPLFYSESTGDYHLQSQFGRWNGTKFVFTDTNLSPCVDAGDPGWPYANEVEDNGDRVNMGRYGNTVEASRTAFLPLEVDNFEIRNLTSNSVDIVGQLLASNATATIYTFFGTSDEGTNFTWEAAATNIAPPIGFFTNTVSLTPERVYYWRCYATNAFRDNWAQTTEKFMTGALIVEAPDPTASEFGPETGTFAIHRPADCTNGPWTVSYTMSGTANNGLDYTTLSGSATFAEGETNISLTVTPLLDLDLGETSETVILNLTDADNHLLGSPSNNTVTITNNPLYNVVYVDTDAVGDNNGTSWTHAYTSLTNALGSQSDDMAFWIAEGTYTPGGASAQYFNIGSKDLYGGFVGTETNVNERDWTNNLTILETDTTDQRIIHKSTDGTAILDGLIIKDGSKTSGGSDGGALECTDGNMIIRNCTFTNNVADDHGGAIYFDSSGETHVISNTLFVGDSSTTVNEGGAIYLNNGDIDAWNCTFRDNSVSVDGGAIWIDSNDKPTPSFYDCTFINNTAPNDEGGVMFIENNRVADWGTFLFQGCTFDSNSAGNADWEGGGCIYAMEGDFIIKVVDCLFTNNSANQEGGCIFIEGGDWGATVQIYDSQFYNNSATDGACVWQNSFGYNNKTIVSNCWFENNTASSEGGALYIPDTDGFEIMDCNFPTNKATDYGGHIYAGVRDGKSGLIANCNFTNGVVLNNDGGAIYIQSMPIRSSESSIRVTNCVFNSNVAGTAGDDRGGAIYGIEMGSLYVNNCLFTNNVAGDEGGAICFDGGDFGPSLTLLNSQFYNNTGANGGAVWHTAWEYGGHLVSNCLFRDNTVSGAGGAIYMSSADGFIIKDCSFPTNRATGQGGHFYGNVRDGYEGVFDNVTFENGISDTDDGGAVMIQSSRSTMAMTFTNCTFRDCRAGTAGDDRGGAIYAEEGGILTVVDCLITNVTAGDEGGAICLAGGDFSMILNMFDTDIYDASGAIGGAVWLDGWDDDNGYTIISNSSFRNCSATGQGGAIHLANVENTEIINSTFSYCDSSGNQGGAIYKSPGASDVTTINNCTFHTNTSSSGGGAIYLHEGILNITNSIFYENYASANGDAIYGDNGDTISIAWCNVDTNKIENIGTKNWGVGIINTNPLFVSAVSNDYHLKSEWGHYVNATSWVNDAETSQCVLQGQPNVDYAREPHHNGRRNNMGRYGNHPEASKHLYLWVENVGVSQVQETSVTLNGELEATNGIPTTVYTFYGTVNAGTNKTWQNEVRNAGALEGAFSNNVSSLTASTKYYWRCYATNAIEEHWSTNVMEVFTAGSPVVTNGPATALSYSSARISGGLEAGGYANAWICWGTNDGGTISTSYWDNVVPIGTATQDVGFATTASGLETNKTYWFRCYVSNAGGSDWSDNPTPFEPVPFADFDSYKLKITFTNFAGRGVLTNFPALVKFTTNNVNNYNGFLDTANGWDLRFWTNESLAGTQLDYEIEAWSANDLSGFSPTDVSGCTLWLDADVGVTVDGSGNVTNWADQSGAGNHVTSSGANAPLLVSSELNGRDVIQFDGGDEYMLAATMPLGAGDDDYTYFAVWQTFDTSGAEVIMEQGAGSGNRSSLIKVNANYGFSGEGNDWYTTPFTVNAWSVSDMKVDNSTSPNINLYHNNSEYSGTAGTPGNLNVDTDGFRVGAKLNNSEYLNGEIAELLVYTNALSAADRASIRSYLDNKYNLNGDIADDSSYIWVKIPELTNNLSIWATWGDETYNSQETYTTNGDVWTEGFAGVWHLKDDVKDSTANNNDGTKENSTSTNGMIGRCQYFDDDGDDFSCGNDASLFNANTITLSAWWRAYSITTWDGIMGRGDDKEYQLEFDSTSTMQIRVDNDNGQSPNTAISLNTWYYVVGTYGDGANNVKIYKDGVLQNTASTGAITDQNNNFAIGARGYGARTHRGEIDEVRMSTVARGSNWIWACWMNQGTNHSSFQVYENVVPVNDDIQNLAPTYVTQTSATFNATLFCPENGFDVFVHWSQTNHSTNFTWNNSANVGGWTNAAETNISYKAVNLETGTQYYYTFRITNATTNIWAEPIWNFLSASPSVVIVKPEVNNTAGPSGISGSGATLNGNITQTGGEDPTVTVYWGDNDGKTTAGNWDTNINMGILGAGTFSTNVTTASSNKTYYYRTAAANSAGTTWSSTTKAWMVKPITKADWHLVSLPVHWGVAASNDLSSELGAQLATGLDSGTGPGDSDNLWLQINGSFVQYWLDSGNTWKSNATAADITIEPGQGFWIKRLTSSADDAMIFSGNAHTNSVEITFNNGAWTVFSWPYSPQGQANWGFDDAVSGFAWETSDNIIGEYNGSWFAIYYRDGTWCKRGTATPTTVEFEAGRAYYYYHRGGSSMQWTAPNN